MMPLGGGIHPIKGFRLFRGPQVVACGVINGGDVHMLDHGGDRQRGQGIDDPLDGLVGQHDRIVYALTSMRPWGLMVLSRMVLLLVGCRLLQADWVRPARGGSGSAQGR